MTDFSKIDADDKYVGIKWIVKGDPHFKQPIRLSTIEVWTDYGKGWIQTQ